MKIIACMFPGQGSQQQNMGEALYHNQPRFQEIIDQSSQILGYDVMKIITDEPEKLNQTVYTQPVLFSVEYAAYQLVKDFLVNSQVFFLGHSLGEWTALVCAKAIGFESALRLIRSRAQLMQDAMPKGAGKMVAVIGFDLPQLKEALARHTGQNEVVEIVNYNSPKQVVIAGHSAAIEKLTAYLTTHKIVKRAIPLPVSVPAHSTLLKAAAEKFKQLLDTVEFSDPQTPIIHNSTAKEEPAASAYPSLLSDHIAQPVLWEKSLHYLQSTYTPDLYLEIGPGTVLKGLCKHIVTHTDIIGVCDQDSIDRVAGKV